jgi:hypothetical protein
MVGLLIGIIVVANQMVKGSQLEIQSKQNHDLSHFNKISTVSNVTMPLNASSANMTTPALATNNTSSANMTTPALATNNTSSANMTTPALPDNYSINKTSFTSQKPSREIVNLQQVKTTTIDQSPNKQISKKPHSDINVNTPNNLDDNTKTKSVHKIKANHKSTDQLNTNSISHSKTPSKQKTNTFSDPSSPSESFDLPFAAIVPNDLF